MFARRGILGILFGGGIDGSSNVCSDFSGGNVELDSGRGCGDCGCGVYRCNVEFQTGVDRRNWLSVCSGGLSDAVGTKGVNDNYAGQADGGRESRVDVDSGGGDAGCAGGEKRGEFGESFGVKSASSGSGFGSVVNGMSSLVPGLVGNGGSFSSILGSDEKIQVEERGKERVVSEKTLANRKRRQEKKELKKARQAGMKRDDWRVREGGSVGFSASVGTKVVVPEKTELRVSLEQKWMAENAVAAEKARQELELVKLRDIAKEAKKREVAVTRQTECNKVAIEQAFGSLKATGNVPGFCATVVSDATIPSLTSGSISPNSSVSEAEIRKAVKELEDSRVEIAKLKRRLRDRDIADLRDGVTVAFSADMSEGLRKEIDEACDGMPTEYDIPEDLDTVYVKKSGSFQFQ